MSENSIDHSPIIFEDKATTEIAIQIKKVEYILREADGDSACQYRNAMMKCTELTDRDKQGRTVRVGNMADTEPFLVHLCLFDMEDRNVPLKKIRTWPPRIITKLYEKAKEISELDQEDDVNALIKQRDKLNDMIAKLQSEDPAKNEPSETLFGCE